MYTTPDKIIEKGFLSDIYKPRKSVGIIIDKSQGNQMSYDSLMAVQNYLPSEIEVCFFVNEITPLPLTPITGLYHSIHMYSYQGNLIATSLSSIQDAQRSGCGGKIIYYIRDLKDLSMYQPELVEDILKSPSVIKVCASKNYSKFVIQNYPSAIISNQIVEDFNIEDFCNIIFGEKNGIQKQARDNDRTNR